MTGAVLEQSLVVAGMFSLPKDFCFVRNGRQLSSHCIKSKPLTHQLKNKIRKENPWYSRGNKKLK